MTRYQRRKTLNRRLQAAAYISIMVAATSIFAATVVLFAAV